MQGQRTTRGRLFCADTVRDMLCNATYCGYISSQRDRTKQIKGLHEAIVPEALFDRCMTAIRTLGRAWTRVLWRCWQDHTPYEPARHGALNAFLAHGG